MLAVDLFSGAGGFHLGFEKAGFTIGLCIDNDINVEKTHRLNYKQIPFLNQDIRKTTSQQIRDVIGTETIDVLVGGPPCQGFSTIGKRVSSDPLKRAQRDPRNELVFHYARLLRELNPKFLVMENVKGIITLDQGRYLNEVLRLIRAAGYSVDYRIINMADYGVPQVRERVVIIGNRMGLPVTFPEPDHFENPEDNQLSWVNCWSVLDDLVDIEIDKSINHVPLKHTHRIIERYRLIPEGGRLPEDQLPPELYRKNFGNTYKRLNRSNPALTMVPGNDAFPIHPILNRSLTVREAARIQTFSDSIIFCGNRRQQGHQVGNAVPPLFSKKLANHLISLINNIEVNV